VRTYFFKTPSWLKHLYPSLTWDKYQKNNDKCVYLTFDDGPIPEVTPWVLELLRKYDVSATFFVVGDNVRKHPGILANIIGSGHSIGNHTYNHINGWNLKNKGVETTLFRPPYGKIKRNQIASLCGAHEIIMWDYLSGDFDPALTADQVIDQFKKKVRAGSIIVFHDNIKSFDTLRKVLPVFLDFFRSQGYHFMTL